MEPTPITIPLLNPNEPDGILAAVHASEGQKVTKGDLLFTLETTKATSDVVAETSGYLVGVCINEGDTVRAGNVFAYVAESADWQPPEDQARSATETSASPAGLRITQPALVLAKQHQIDLNGLPVGPMITEATIRNMIQGVKTGHVPVPADSTALIIYGGGGHGKALIDLIRELGTYTIIGIIDDGLQVGEKTMGVPVLGGSAELANLHAQGVQLAVNAVGGINNIQTRIKVFRQLAKAGFACPALVHPASYVEPSASLAPGVQVFPHAYVGSEVQVGFGVILNTGVIVSHDCKIGDYANLSPGAILAGMVKIGDHALIGMGVTINLNVEIGSGARVGNSATVKGDVPVNGIVRAGATFPA